MKNKMILSLVLLVFLSSITMASGNGATLIELTEEEQLFITEHPVVNLGVDPSFVPFEFIDIDGEYKGIAKDYIDLISERTGIQMIVVKDLTWSQAYEAAVEKRIDVLPCVSKTTDRELYFHFSEPYYRFQRVIVVKTGEKDIKSYEDLYGLKVAVQEYSSHHSYLKDFEGINLSLYKTAEQALAAVTTGQETAFVGNLATSSYLINTEGFTNLRYVPFDESEQNSLSFAVRNDWPELVSIIDKGLASITDEEKIAINNRWIGMENTVDYSRIIEIAIGIGLLILLIMVVSFYWILRLNKEVQKRKLIEEDLISAKQEAESANFIKSSFLARMSHEIRTPLNAITGMAYLLKKTDMSVTQKMHLEKITQASSNMLNIINDILDFSKIEAGKVELEHISFNLDKSIQNVLNIISYRVEEKGIGFSITKEPSLANNFIGDPKRIEQILINLISNAVKFTDKGEVSLIVRLIAKEDNHHHLEFIVKDTGKGMSKEHITKLFTPFTQEDSSINRQYGGTGLGLSIVKSLVEMMAGEIKVYSTINKGSTFIVKLILDSDDEKEQEEKELAAAVYFHDIKTIILERTSSNLNLIGSYVRSFGMNTELTTSQNHLIQLLVDSNGKYKKPYDLLIVDYDTLSDECFTFIESISKNSSIVTKPKIIVMLPFAREDLFDQIDEYGIDLGICKPIIPSLLYNGILELFTNRAFEPDKVNKNLKTLINTERTKSYHVLIVDDNKTNQFIAKSILDEVGFESILADNGKVAVELYIANKDMLDLILMDLHMPVMNGYDATTEIRKLDKEIPIIAMTADAVTGVEEKCQTYGIDFYISKPFDPEQFVSKILKLVEERRSVSNSERQVTKEDMVLTVLDEKEGLRRLGNNRQIYDAVLLEYYRENHDTMETLNKSIEEMDYPQAAQIVHKIKSSTASIGATRLHKVATELQKALESKDRLEVGRWHDEFNVLLKILMEEIGNR